MRLTDRPKQWWEFLIDSLRSALSRQAQASMLLIPSVTHPHTYTHTSCLPHFTACCTPGAMSNRRVIPGTRLGVGGASHHTCQSPNTQAKWCVTPAWKWGKTLMNPGLLHLEMGERQRKRESERLGNLLSAKPPQLAPLIGRVALIPNNQIWVYLISGPWFEKLQLWASSHSWNKTSNVLKRWLIEQVLAVIIF